MEVDEWWRRVVDDIARAKKVQIATLLYDHPRLHAALLRRLRGPGAFALSVAVDKESLGERVSFNQRPRLLELHGAGAEVRVGRGLRGKGRLHAKAMCIDGRIAFAGSPNFTKKSEDNDELCFRFTGRPVVKILAFVEKVTAKARVWKGS